MLCDVVKIEELDACAKNSWNWMHAPKPRNHHEKKLKKKEMHMFVNQNSSMRCIPPFLARGEPCLLMVRQRKIELPKFSTFTWQFNNSLFSDM